MILDAETMDVQDKDSILGLFYSDIVDNLIQPFSFPKSKSLEQQEALNTALYHICTLLSFCVQQHGYRIKYFLLRNKVIQKILSVIDSDDKQLVLGKSCSLFLLLLPRKKGAKKSFLNPSKKKFFFF